METCGFCKETNDKVIDRICPKCEPLWLDNIEKAAKSLGPNGSINNMINYASVMTQIEHEKRTKGSAN